MQVVAGGVMTSQIWTFLFLNSNRLFFLSFWTTEWDYLQEDSSLPTQ